MKQIGIITFIFILLGSVMSFSFGEYDNVRVKGTFKIENSEGVSISLYDIQTKKSQPITFSKNKFEFFVAKNKFKLLTIKDENNQGKSIFISTYTKAEFDKRQQFIVIIDLTEKTVNIDSAVRYATTCTGSIKYSKKHSKFYYLKKPVTYDEIIADIKEKTTPDPTKE